MSPAVEEIRKTVEDRIRELGPVITELEQLQNILSLLETGGQGLSADAAGSSSSDMPALLAQLGLAEGRPLNQSPIRRSRRGTKPGRDGRAPQGANKQRIIEAVLEDPGVTATEIAERTGVKRTVVSATINRLKRNGELEPDGRGVRVARVPSSSIPEPVGVS
ncbi:MAG TPA: winged helix-turn-helix domain-containing protein [Solirubrobacterales bacterium]|nr:winged helix-turn-helix domain-containing protein [Solirubrobacterales bacterium]